MTSPIKEVLNALNRHADLVETALSGMIFAEGASPASIATLRQASALRAVGESGYRLHPRLREYLHDHLQLIPAFQSLAEIGSRITHMQALWTEIDTQRFAVDQEALSSLLESMSTSIYDIEDSVERNLLILQTLVSTRFGNVKSLATKRSQNNYYQTQTTHLSGDLVRLARVAEGIEREASVRGLDELAIGLRRGVLARLMGWQAGLSEMQTEIRKELYRTREVERQHKLLARMDMMLRQQPAWRGFDVDLPDIIPDFLLAARLPALVPHVEPMESDRSIADEMAMIAKSLPPRRLVVEDPEPPRRYTLVEDPPVERKPSPAAKAMVRLARAVNVARAPISLIEWREADADARTLRSDVWLVYAVLGMRTRNFKVEVLANQPHEGEQFAHSFSDARVSPNRLAPDQGASVR
ncbi:hypothetical protein [uncultured Variovorax sp.]|uniref:hypothetical protein n=1 Tax=uncultured Variovorax sp. TaxID=114708 RepID=UPI00261BD1F7|nr:hypothetical protein [uncultured Variovorax sp.]